MVDLTMALFAKFWVNGNQDELVVSWDHRRGVDRQCRVV
jgi:hypothetical protein